MTENLDQVVSNLRAGCDYRLENGRLENITAKEARQHLSVYEMFNVLGVAEAIMKKHADVLRQLQD